MKPLKRLLLCGPAGPDYIWDGFGVFLGVFCSDVNLALFKSGGSTVSVCSPPVKWRLRRFPALLISLLPFHFDDISLPDSVWLQLS